MPIDVNAVPLNFLEYRLPKRPTTNAPMADTMSERSKMKWFAAWFAAYAAHDMTPMTNVSLFQNGCKFAIDDRIENSGTMMNCVHHGNGWSHHG